MPMSPVTDSSAALTTQSAALLTEVSQAIGGLVLGKEQQIRLSLCCLLAEGHLLIEDIPGIGKTTLAKVLARVLGLDFRRIQCTSDMLPGDILGVSVFDPNSASFSFHPGPIFTQVLLADEINRTTPKTQSALLEAMEEQQVSLDGTTRKLAPPFLVIATQNPLEQAGTYPLPESQLDRFLFRITIGYPDHAAENRLLTGGGALAAVAELPALLNAERILVLQQQARAVHVAAPLVQYVQGLLDFSRNSGRFTLGLSPRAGLSLLRAAKSWALLAGRDYALPEDIQAVLLPVAGHRLRQADSLAAMADDELRQAFFAVPVPV
jgi:MoxR-like ATPase